MTTAPLFDRLCVTGSINRYRRHRSDWSWPRVHRWGCRSLTPGWAALVWLSGAAVLLVLTMVLRGDIL